MLRPMIDPHENARIDDPQPFRALHPQVCVNGAILVVATPHPCRPRRMPYRRRLRTHPRIDFLVGAQVYTCEGCTLSSDETVPRMRRDEACCRTDRGAHHLDVKRRVEERWVDGRRVERRRRG